MASLYIQSSQDLAQHRKVRRLMRMLKISLPDAIGRLNLLWWWAMTYAQDGDLGHCDADDIADVVMWDKDAGQLLDALITCGGKDGHGFIDRDEDGSLSLHDWSDHCRVFEERAKDSERKRQYRAAKKQDVHSASSGQEQDKQVSSENVQRASDGHPEDVHGTMPEIHPLDKDIDKDKDINKNKDLTPPSPPSQGGGRGEYYPPDFELFWADYPRKVQKQAAFRAWLGIVRHGANPKDVNNAAAAYQAAVVRNRRPMDKTMHATTFMHEDRWKDWLPPDGASYLESLVSPAHGQDSQVKANIPKSYEEAVAMYGKRGNAIDVEAVEVARNDERAGLRAVC